MKKIGIVVPTLNEQDNVKIIFQKLTNVFKESLPNYDYEIMFIDNFSTDDTRKIILELADLDRHVRAIFNARNFGFVRSTFYGLTQSEADCTFLIFADMQDPPELLPKFVEKWESGYKLVVGIKKNSKESRLMFALRTAYYKTIEKISDSEQIEHFNGYGLYDKQFIEILRKLDDPYPYLKGIVSEMGFRRTEIYYLQNVRERGTSNFNILKLYDVAMLGVTCYSKTLLRMATFVGGGIGLGSVFFAIVVFVRKIMFWEEYAVGIATITISLFFLFSILLVFIGILGEYVLNINTHIMHRPLVIEEKRINFDECIEETDNAFIK